MATFQCKVCGAVSEVDCPNMAFCPKCGAPQQAAPAKSGMEKKKLLLIAVPILLVAAVLVGWFVMAPILRYNEAVELMSAGKYEQAIQVFQELDGYRDSDTQIKECKYSMAVQYMERGEDERAIAMFEQISGYRDSDHLIGKIIFDGDWVWINPETINPYDSFIIDYDAGNVRYHFQSSMLVRDVDYTFTVNSPYEIYAKGLRYSTISGDSSPVKIQYVSPGKLKLIYDDPSTAPSSNSENLYLVRP